MLREETLRRLESQHEVIPFLLAGAVPEALDARPAPGKWSARENLAHIARHQALFLERMRRILEEDTPDLGRYRAEADPEWPEWSGLPLEEVLSRLRDLRGKIGAQASRLSDEDLRRGGVHPLLGEMSLARWAEFFLLHEAHHLYTVMLCLGEARRSAG